MLNCQRGLFSLPEDEHYLNCAYMGPFLKSVEAAGIEGLRRKSVPTSITPTDSFTGPNELRRLFGELVNAPPERVALVPSVSYGVAIASQNLALGRGKNIVVPGELFPSNVYAWRRLATASGGEVRFVRRPRNGEWTDAVLESISGAW